MIDIDAVEFHLAVLEECFKKMKKFFEDNPTLSEMSVVTAAEGAQLADRTTTAVENLMVLQEIIKPENIPGETDLEQLHDKYVNTYTQLKWHEWRAVKKYKPKPISPDEIN